MQTETTNILKNIIDNKKKELELRKKEMPLESFTRSIKNSTKKFSQAITKKDSGNFPKLIAEIKFASPSSGKIRKATSDEVLRITKLYSRYAGAISVLTDKKYFTGDIKYLKIAGKNTNLPILRKDFIIDKYQIYESRHYGADAVLLIASVLGEKNLKDFIKTAKELGMDCLVEVHDKKDLHIALNADAEIIGINNRNLKTMTTDLNTTIELSKHIPKNTTIVSESAIKTKQDIEFLQPADIDAILVGTAIMKSDIEQKLKELAGAHR